MKITVNLKEAEINQVRYAVYSGSEKIDLGEKKAIAFTVYESDAKLLIEKFYPYGYYEKITE